MNYYSYLSYHLANRFFGSLGCVLAWYIIGTGWWSLPLALLFFLLWLPVILKRPHFLSINADFIAWGNSITRRQIAWDEIAHIGYTPKNEAKPGFKIELKNGSLLKIDPSCFDSIAQVRQAIIQASGVCPIHLAPDLFADMGLLSE